MFSNAVPKIVFTIISPLNAKFINFLNLINASLYCSVFKSNTKKRVNEKLRLSLILC